MKRFILEINEDEKNRIRLMHESVRSNLFEQETVTQEGGEKFSDQIAIPTLEDASKLVGSYAAKSEIKTVENLAKKYNKDDVDYNQQLVSSYGDNYTTFINGLERGGTKKEFDIWYKQLTQDTRIAFLNQWKAYLETASKKIQKGKQEVKITLSKGKKTTKKVELPPNITTPPEPVTYLKEFKDKGQGENVYDDNKSEVTAYMQEEIQKIVEAAQDLMNKAKAAGGTVECTGLEVTSSSSRLRNTGDAVNKTWLQLSKERAENVKTLLVTKLKGLGVYVPDNVIVLKGGVNGDGTSGPNPPRVDSKGNKYNLTSDGITIIKDTDTLRNKVFSDGNGSFTITTPSKNITDYLQFKFCIISVIFQVTWNTLPVEVKKFQSITYKNFSMDIDPVYKIPSASTSKMPSSGFGSKLLPKVSEGTVRKNEICAAFGG